MPTSAGRPRPGSLAGLVPSTVDLHSGSGVEPLQSGGALHTGDRPAPLRGPVELHSGSRFEPLQSAFAPCALRERGGHSRHLVGSASFGKIEGFCVDNRRAREGFPGPVVSFVHSRAPGVLHLRRRDRRRRSRPPGPSVASGERGCSVEPRHPQSSSPTLRPVHLDGLVRGSCRSRGLRPRDLVEGAGLPEACPPRLQPRLGQSLSQVLLHTLSADIAAA